MKKCNETTATCVRCSNQGYNKGKCTSAKVRCCHWEADNKTFSRSCPLLKTETEITQVQRKERTPRLQAKRKLLRLNPDPQSIFSNAVENSINPTRSKSLTKPKQESQSESSEDTNVTLKFFVNFGNEGDNSPTVPTYGHGYFTKIKGKNKRSLPSSPLTLGAVR